MTQIYDWNDLDSIRNDLSGDHQLMNDLDRSTDGYADIGADFKPIGIDGGDFSGTFDGQGNTISDLQIMRNGDDGDGTEIALFATFSEPMTIENLGIVNATVWGRNADETAILLGTNSTTEGGETIENCFVHGSVYGDSGLTAGIVGQAYGATIRGCYSVCLLTGSSSVGGIVGDDQGATVDQCYTASRFFGQQDMDAGAIASPEYVGTVTDCYYDSDLSGSISDSDATGLTTSEMQGSDLSGFDYSSRWETIAGSNLFTGEDGYPVLQAFERDAQLEMQKIETTEALTGTITRTGSAASNAVVWGRTEPNGKTAATTADSNGDYSLDIPKDGDPPFEVAVGADYDDDGDRYAEAESILFDP